MDQANEKGSRAKCELFQPKLLAEKACEESCDYTKESALIINKEPNALIISKAEFHGPSIIRETVIQKDKQGKYKDKKHIN